MERIVAKVDVNAVFEQVDLDALVERTQIGSLIARTGAGAAAKVVDVARSQGVGLDSFVQNCMNRLLRRDRSVPVGRPPLLVEREPMTRMTAHVAGVAGVEPERDVGLQGCYAGFVTRLAAFVIDLITALALFAVGARIGEYIVTALTGDQVQLSNAPIVADILLIAWWIFYSAYPLAEAGRTVGMAVVGLRVVHADGSDIDAGHAFFAC